MSKKFEHLDALAQFNKDDSIATTMSIYKETDGWTMYHPLKRIRITAPTLSELNLMARDDLNALTWSLKKQGYGKKEPVKKEKKEREIEINIVSKKEVDKKKEK